MFTLQHKSTTPPNVKTKLSWAYNTFRVYIESSFSNSDNNLNMLPQSSDTPFLWLRWYIRIYNILESNAHTCYNYNTLTSVMTLTAESEGELSEPAYNPCHECVCTDSTWLCTDTTCPHIDCPLRERLTKPGECCPTCAGCYTDQVRKVRGGRYAMMGNSPPSTTLTELLVTLPYHYPLLQSTVKLNLCHNYLDNCWFGQTR